MSKLIQSLDQNQNNKQVYQIEPVYLKNYDL